MFHVPQNYKSVRREVLVFGVKRMKKTCVFLVYILAFSTSINSVSGAYVITIKSDGSIDPPTVPIRRDGTRYTFEQDIHGRIVVERDNIVIDGEDYTLKVASGCPVAYRNGVSLGARRNVTIENMRIEIAWYGILAENCSDITISGVTVAESLHGILFSNCSNNKIIGNSVTSNYHNGVQIIECSSDNTIQGNIIIDNGEEGIMLELSPNNSITENVIERNLDGIVLIESSCNRILRNNITANMEAGMWLYCSSENLVNHNNFIYNTLQIYTFDSRNVWDDATEGNYWSNYAGFDSDGDGIGDTSYIIDSSNQDRYPSVNLYVISEFSTVFLMLSMIAMIPGMIIRKKRMLS